MLSQPFKMRYANSMTCIDCRTFCFISCATVVKYVCFTSLAKVSKFLNFSGIYGKVKYRFKTQIF